MAVKTGIKTFVKEALLRAFHLSAQTRLWGAGPLGWRRSLEKPLWKGLGRWFAPRYLSYPTGNGRIFLNLANAPSSLRRVLGTFERDKFAAAVSFLEPGMTFVDIGANMGDFSLLAARAVGPEGEVIACEPEPTNAEMVRRSVGINGLKNVRVRQVAVGAEDGRMSLHIGASSGHHTLLPGLPRREQGTIAVDVRSLDSLLEELGVDKVDVMKIDVEGAEMMVLRGAERTLERNPRLRLLMDLHPHLGTDAVETCDLLKKRGFRILRMAAPHAPMDPIRDDLRECMAVR